MNGLSLEQTYQPTQVITVYKSTQGAYYLESAPVYENKGKITYGASSPLSKATLSCLGEYFHKEGKVNFSCKKLLPKNLIYSESKNLTPTLVWYMKKSRQHLCFSSSLAIENGWAWMPNLLFVAQGVTLYVYAYKEDGIDLQTELYKAPFHNLYGDGKVCIGNQKEEGGGRICRCACLLATPVFFALNFLTFFLQSACYPKWVWDWI